jgi:hypothetical protein
MRYLSTGRSSWRASIVVSTLHYLTVVCLKTQHTVRTPPPPYRTNVSMCCAHTYTLTQMFALTRPPAHIPLASCICAGSKRSNQYSRAAAEYAAAAAAAAAAEGSGMSEGPTHSQDPPPPALAMLASMGYGPQGSQGGGGGGCMDDSYSGMSGASSPTMHRSSRRGGGGGGTSRLQHSMAPGTHR